MRFPCPSCAAPLTAHPERPGRFAPVCPACKVTVEVEVRVSTAVHVAAAVADVDNTFASVPADPDSTFTPADEFSGAMVRTATGEDTTGTDGEPPPSRPRAAMPRLAGYELVRELGRGGMGAVYLARQTSLDRRCAVKVVNGEWAGDPVFLARFAREAKAAARLVHPNVVQVYEFARTDGVAFFSMEYVDGRSLAEVMKADGPLPPGEAVGYVIQAARGLQYAHARGLVHRDIKPDNLILSREGVVKVADLGLVKMRGPESGAGNFQTNEMPTLDAYSALRAPHGGFDITRAGSAMGSPSYMAPEQCRDAATVDERADVYSLGCTLYALLAGRTPFTGSTAVELISQHLSEPPPPLSRVAADVPDDLAEVVDRTLAKDPADRFQSMNELIAALEDWQRSRAARRPAVLDFAGV